MTAIVLVAHGSRDPRSALTMREVGRRVALRWPGGATTAFLDFDTPSVPGALRELPIGRPAIVVPALLTNAYHGRIDLPNVLSSVATRTTVTTVLGPAQPGEMAHPLLLAALMRRLSELDVSYDGVALIAAGTSDAGARSTVEGVARELASQVDVACCVGYASTSSPTAAEAVTRLRASGCRRVVAASYFLAPGRLHDAAAGLARLAGAVAVAAPLGAAPELVELIATRAAATSEYGSLNTFACESANL
jgi:sirohydrochlorin ferrochelatase